MEHCALSLLWSGYFCPVGTSALLPSLQCATPSQYCPTGTTTPVNTSVGYYVLSTSTLTNLFYNQTLCEPGRYCVGGVAYPCAAGYFGNASGLTIPQCTGPCTQGYYCPPQSTSPTQTSCGSAAVFCPAVSSCVCSA